MFGGVAHAEVFKGLSPGEAFHFAGRKHFFLLSAGPYNADAFSRRYRNSERMSLSNPVISNAGSGGPRAAAAPLAGFPDNLGKYVLRRELGRGGMGVVYEGEDTLLERAVAIKWLVPPPGQPAAAEPATLDRLLREARWAARLNHPNTVAVYDAGEHERGVYIAMELVRGRSAYEHLQQGQFTWQQATRIAAEICRGLSAAHAAGLIHRDIKPANILLVDAAGPGKTPDGRAPLPMSSVDSAGYQPWAKLSDFGLSRSLNYNVPVTVEGQVAGTPHYMSPEQIRGERLDQRTDLYSLGATYFTLLTGRLPYERDDVIQVLFAHCSAPPPDPAAIDPNLPAACGAIIARCLAKEPRERFSSAAELQLHLDALLAGESKVETRERRPLLPVIDPAWLVAERRPRAHSTQRRSAQLAIASGGLAVVAVLLVALLLRGYDPHPQRAGNAQSPAAPAALSSTAPLRPALPVEGFTIEKPWTETHDGLFQAHGEMEFMTLAPDGRTLAWGISEGIDGIGRLTLYDLERQTVVGNVVQERQFASFSAVAFPSERYVLLARSNSIVVIDRDTNQSTTLVDLSDGSARSIDVSADGQRLAHGVVEWDGGGRVELYDLVLDETGPRVENKRLANREHNHPVKSVAISPNGKYVGSASEDGSVLIGDAVTGETRHVLSLPGKNGDWSEMGYALKFSPDSSLVAAGGERRVVLWDVATGQQRLLPERHLRNITSLAFSADGQFVAAGSTDGVRIWNVVGGWQAGQTLQGHEGNIITGLAFARGAAVLITSGFDRRIHLLNLGKLKRSANEE